MPIVKPCPKSCKFDWVKFHQDLDIALAHMIDEAGIDTPIEEYGPSYISALQFAQFAHGKKILQEKGQYAPEAE